MITLKEAIQIAEKNMVGFIVEKCWDLGNGWLFNHYDPELDAYPDVDPTFVYKEDGKVIGFWIAEHREQWKNRVEVDISNFKIK